MPKLSLLGRRAAALTAIGRAIRDSRRPGAPGFQERLAAAPRMLRAAAAGEYDGLSRRRLALMAAAAAYVVSPVDVLPEGLLLVLGMGDDVVVGTWLFGALLEETEKFLAWEAAQGRVVPGEAVASS